MPGRRPHLPDRSRDEPQRDRPEPRAPSAASGWPSSDAAPGRASSAQTRAAACTPSAAPSRAGQVDPTGHDPSRVRARCVTTTAAAAAAVNAQSRTVRGPAADTPSRSTCTRRRASAPQPEGAASAHAWRRPAPTRAKGTNPGQHGPATRSTTRSAPSTAPMAAERQVRLRIIGRPPWAPASAGWPGAARCRGTRPAPGDDRHTRRGAAVCLALPVEQAQPPHEPGEPRRRRPRWPRERLVGGLGRAQLGRAGCRRRRPNGRCGPAARRGRAARPRPAPTAGRRRPRGDGAAQLGTQRPLLAEGAAAGLGTSQPEEHPGELVVPSDGRHLDDPGTTEHRQARPGHRSRGSARPRPRPPRRRRRGWSGAPGRVALAQVTDARRRRRAPRRPGRRTSS